MHFLQIGFFSLTIFRIFECTGWRGSLKYDTTMKSITCKACLFVLMSQDQPYGLCTQEIVTGDLRPLEVMCHLGV